MTLDGLFRFLHFPPGPADAENAHLNEIWGEQLVTAAAVAAAMLIVAMITVLMGMVATP
jgi:hypothetical protein